jgi:hypothetical protein
MRAQKQVVGWKNRGKGSGTKKKKSIRNGAWGSIAVEEITVKELE